MPTSPNYFFPFRCISKYNLFEFLIQQCIMFVSLTVVNVSTQSHSMDSHIVNTSLRLFTETRKIHESLEI